jgi:Cysteine rich repeat
MRKSIAVAFMLTIAAPLPAIAYTQADIDACTSDAIRFCQQAFPSKGRVVLCLVENRRRLTPACTLAFERARSEIAENGHGASVRQTKY